MKSLPTSVEQSKQLVLDLDDVPRVDSRMIASELGNEHPYTYRMIAKYKNDFEEFGKVRFENAPSTSGQTIKIALLNEDQCYLLLTYSKNTERARKLKRKLVREFGRLRRQAERRAEREWQQARLEGKDARRHETDTIQAFVQYATGQGSRNARKYFINLTKMTYKAMGLVEQGLKTPGGLRNLLTGMELTFLAGAEYVCANALTDGMKEGLHYKDVYILAKERVEVYATSIGKTKALPH